MKVFLSPEAWMSRGIQRVAIVLARYAPPGVEIVLNEDEADFSIVHMVGNGQRQLWLEPKRPYAVIQYCLRTTELPNTRDWIPVWNRATAVWSYYDLKAAIEEDGSMDLMEPDSAIHLYYQPLGVDLEIFRPSALPLKKYLIGTSGYIAETEGVVEAHAACQRLGRRMFHLGPQSALPKAGPTVVFAHQIPDEAVAGFWSACTYVAGLRRIEGFELPVLEGLACGARPIVFDAPHYRKWFGDLAEYIPERSPEDVTNDLTTLMSKPARPVTPEERLLIARRFDWYTLATGFWQEALR